MKPATPETAELLHRVRQQLILAQVRIMELEDGRDEQASRLAEVEKLLAAAQTLADQKTGEATHLARTLADLQSQYDYLRHMQHVTNEALNETRRQLAETGDRLAAAEKQGARQQAEIQALTGQVAGLNADCDRLGRKVAEATATAAVRLERGDRL